MSIENWENVKIPPDSPLIKIIRQNKGIAKHKALENNMIKQPKTKEEKVDNAFKMYINYVDSLYPGSKNKLEMIEPIIRKKILKIFDDIIVDKFIDLNDEYYDYLRESLNK